MYARFPFVDGTAPVTTDLAQLVLNRTWRPQLATIGMDGIPSPGDAGNVLRPWTSAKISLRLPPTLNADEASAIVDDLFLRDPPYGASVSFVPDKASAGWHAPPLAPWLAASVERASQNAFGRGAAMMGEGGSIPFMGMLGEKFPAAQFVITGVLGPQSNAHGPNEFLHLPTGKKVSAVVAQVIADHAAR
jgi:acetylornithine deacetylase/succinyl-diaminopimelate desuccinylase-like protein